MSTKTEFSESSSVRNNTQKFFSGIILCLLFVTIVSGTSENMHAQMLKMGAYFWPDYFILRGEEPLADCQLNFDIEQRDQLPRLN